MSMSVTGFSSDPNKMYKNSFHWRNDSGELDVFEAAGYFSSVNIDQNPGAYIVNGANFAQKFIREEKQQHVQRAAAARMSLDMPMRNPIPAEYHIMDQKQMIKENKKHKQPSSPGGRLASFLNSLFSQTHLKKKKSKYPAARWKDWVGRRESALSSLFHSSSSPGFRTLLTPIRRYSHKIIQGISESLADLPGRRFPGLENSGNLKPTLEKALFAEKKVTDYAWMKKKGISSGGGKIPGTGIPRGGISNQEFHHELGIQEVQ
ncbi:UNVERIFIED_CONTAM: protein BIG GRAIN 1-like E [Sesamum latifolium]|uniref:Protein BIG GRAIN 1-like E n=1 Tax=Sesamum latifolium TaxID=2727402 RepID=A0AAW2X3X0_9LAMI